MPNPLQVQASKEFDPLAFLSRVGAGKTFELYQKNQTIFSQGDVADAVFFIRSGKIKITVVSEHGKEAVIGVLTESQFFGEGCLDGSKLRGSTSHAITSITKTAMLAAREKEPKFSALFLTYLLSRNSRIEDDLIDQLFNSSERRSW
jgi:CRP/FNR family transcriptional regulator, cyclic AMP receptor protein